MNLANKNITINTSRGNIKIINKISTCTHPSTQKIIKAIPISTPPMHPLHSVFSIITSAVATNLSLLSKGFSNLIDVWRISSFRESKSINKYAKL